MRKVIKWGILGFIGLAILTAAFGGGSKDNTGSVTTDKPSVAQSANSESTERAKPAESAKPKVTRHESKPTMTAGQTQALESARSYIDMSGFSKRGLIEQLSSSAGEGFSKSDATFAANHVGADWKAEAVESAKSYMEMGGFSWQNLMEQLTSSAGEKFTQAQASYAVSKVYR